MTSYNNSNSNNNIPTADKNHSHIQNSTSYSSISNQQPILSTSSSTTTTNTPNSFHRPPMSNLTKNLQSSSSFPSSTSASFNSTEVLQQHHQLPTNPPDYNNSFNNNFNYIPSSHNTPTAVSTSYSSNHSYNSASLPNSNNFITQPPSNNNTFSQQQQQLPNFKPTGIIPHTIPTTTDIHTDPASSSSLVNRNIDASSTTPISNSLSSSSSSTHTNSFPIPNSQNNHNQLYHPPSNYYHQPSSFQNQQRIPNSFPANATINSHPNSFTSQNLNPSQPFNKRFQQQYPRQISTSVSGSSTIASTTPNAHSINISQNDNPGEVNHDARDKQTNSQFQHQSFQQPFQTSSYNPTPDHYMTYNEYLENLKLKDQREEDANGNYEEHLNIVDYPVNDLIVMLSCLLSKIIEANDKLHPNHFENTIAIRQKLKEDKKVKKLQKKTRQEQKQKQQQQQSFSRDIEIEIKSDDEDASEDEESEDDEGAEMKNKYLANVLAFHGTNVPGISLHAYLSRVLKYCPVTNEVFLSLLVYFDRIAKKANNLKKKKNDNANSNEETDEQLFVMDSYNIHRLIISGITVSSKFFSDIFYKNLRYAKVGGLPLEELNYLELQLLLLLDFKLMISVEDLQNYGDLLLRFWKREQISNELIIPSEVSHLQSQSHQQQETQI